VSQSRRYTTTWRVRSYELDSNAHVNNAIYIAYAEEVAAQHAEALGFGREWTLARGALWVVRRHDITYLAPAGYGDTLDLMTEVEDMRGARATRHTTIRLSSNGTVVVDMRTEWVWLRADTGRPQRIPPEIIAAFVHQSECAP
jgi:acyl-CoA thioester hydrolase